MKETKIIDKDNLIIGLSFAVADPIETNKIVKEKLKTIEEVQAIQHHKEQIIKYAKSGMQERKASHQNLIHGKKSDSEKNHQNFLDYEQKIQDTMELMKPVLEKIEKKRRNLVFSDAVYFEPKPGEILITTDEAKSLRKKIKKLPENKRLDKDGKEVFDYRGWTVWGKAGNTWTKTEINDLNVDIGTKQRIQDMNLDDAGEVHEKIEADRISALSPESKTAEKDNAIQYAATKAVSLRSQYEIQGQSTADALTNSTAWYDAEVLKINAKYA